MILSFLFPYWHNKPIRDSVLHKLPTLQAQRRLTLYGTRAPYSKYIHSQSNGLATACNTPSEPYAKAPPTSVLFQAGQTSITQILNVRMY